MSLLYAATLFLSAMLLFVVQPLAGKMLLPILGGTPAVWTVCMAFFQAALLAGYLYAHLSSRALSPRIQAGLHLGVLIGGIIALGASAAMSGVPVAIPTNLIAQAEADPVFGLPLVLLVMVGLPTFALSASAPMLQRWFAANPLVAGRDPYVLYAASNAGSLAGLASFPLLMEPTLRLGEQAWTWALGFLGLGMLTLACAIVLWSAPSLIDNSTTAAAQEKLPWWRRLHWLMLAAVPCSLMIGSTNYLSIDVAPVPLLWVVPLAIYLITFIIAFAHPPESLLIQTRRLVPPALILVMFLLLAVNVQPPLGVVMLLHLGTLALVALTCHGELARLRPEPSRLTEYYLWISIGGVMAGALNAAAPLIFRGVYEYPLALLAATLLLPALTPSTRLSWWLDLFLPMGVGLIAIACQWVWWLVQERGLADSGRLQAEQLELAICFGLPAMGVFACSTRPLRFGLALLALMVVVGSNLSSDRGTLFQERSFFAVLRVFEKTESYGADDAKQTWIERYLKHGTTWHGLQRRDPKTGEPSLAPPAYFDPAGPIGQVFTAFSGDQRKKSVAVLGLGCGTLAAYAEGKDQKFDFYEIDPVVIKIAEDPKLFTFLDQCKAEWKTILGDARLRLAEPDRPKYDLIVADAFSSDAVPVHLINREAVQLYFDRLNPGGLVAMHITNRHLRLEPMLAALAAEEGLAGRTRMDGGDASTGRFATQWVVLARNEADLGPLANDPAWRPLTPRPGVRAWTDDFSNVLSVLSWGQ